MQLELKDRDKGLLSQLVWLVLCLMLLVYYGSQSGGACYSECVWSALPSLEGCDGGPTVWGASASALRMVV